MPASRVKRRRVRRPTELARASAVWVGGLGLALLSASVLLPLWLAPNGRSSWGATLAMLAAATLIWGVAVGSAWAASRGITDDVRFVAERIKAMRAWGEQEATVAMRSLDELGALVRQFEKLRQQSLGILARHREARREAELADQAKTDFLRAIRHELRTPLNAILGFTDVLLQELDGALSPAQREDLEAIQAAGQHLSELLHDVLAFAADGSGQLSLHWAPLDAPKLLRDVAGQFRAQARAAGLRLAVECPTDLPPVLADRRRLQQILSNLVSNALKFTDRGAVVLRAQALPDGLELQVQDSGRGIKASELSRVFEVFGQTPDESRRSRGTGLGLAIVKRLVDLHEGQLQVESQVGEGTCFRIRIPRRCAPDKAPPGTAT
ncbi:MAG: sensor histidine kinase [Polyangiales bacterium]